MTLREWLEMDTRGTRKKEMAGVEGGSRSAVDEIG